MFHLQKMNLANTKYYQKVRDHYHYTGKSRGTAQGTCNLNNSSYDYHCIITELANKFAGKLESFGENTENYKAFSAPIEKKLQKLIKMVMKVL